MRPAAVNNRPRSYSVPALCGPRWVQELEQLRREDEEAAKADYELSEQLAKQWEAEREAEIYSPAVKTVLDTAAIDRDASGVYCHTKLGINSCDLVKVK